LPDDDAKLDSFCPPAPPKPLLKPPPKPPLEPTLPNPDAEPNAEVLVPVEANADFAPSDPPKVELEEPPKADPEDPALSAFSASTAFGFCVLAKLLKAGVLPRAPKPEVEDPESEPKPEDANALGDAPASSPGDFGDLMLANGDLTLLSANPGLRIVVF